MGLYINPPEESKEDFLLRHGTLCSARDVELFRDFGAERLPVVWVDNGPFTAAGIIYSARERDSWLGDRTNRHKRYYFVERKFLEPYLKGIA